MIVHESKDSAISANVQQSSIIDAGQSEFIYNIRKHKQIVMKYFAIVMMLLLSPFTVSEDSQVLIVLKHSTCLGNKKYVEKMTSIRKPINRTTSLTSMDIYFKTAVAVDSPLYISFTANKKFTTQYRQFMVDLKCELCDALRLKNHPLYKFIFDKTNRSESNMLDLCPLKGHRFIKPYYTIYETLPPLIPIGMWRIDVIVTKKLINEEEEVFRFQDYYEVSPRGIIEF